MSLLRWSSPCVRRNGRVTRHFWGAGDRAHHGSNRLLVGGWWRLVAVWSSVVVLEGLLVVKRRWRIWCQWYWVCHCGRNVCSLSAAGSINSLKSRLSNDIYNIRQTKPMNLKLPTCLNTKELKKKQTCSIYDSTNA
jgi:hypothetical protein